MATAGSFRIRLAALGFAVTLLAGLASAPAPACTLSEAPAAARAPKLALAKAGEWAGPSISGSWYDPARSGEGFIVEYLADGSVVAFWFTYPAVGEEGEQAWLILQDGRVDGRTVRFDTVLRPRGARFGDAFDPRDVVLEDWGDVSLEFTACNTAIARWQGPAAYGSGTRTLTRLTALDELGCDGAKALTSSGARALPGLRARSGAWYVPSRSGEGWVIEELADGRMVVYWFTYDPQGKQAWTVGLGQREGNRLIVSENLMPRGTRFGAAFDADDVVREPWGRLELEFTQCAATRVDYASTRPGYGNGTRASVRLTELASAVCLDGTPSNPSALRWNERARMPNPPQSEHAVAVADGKAYVLGGFGDPRGFKRYDPVANTWTELPDLPAGRDHLAAFGFDGSIYYTGGAPNGGGVGGAAHRYDLATGRWQSAGGLEWMFGSHAAVLNGRAYVGEDGGTLQEFDPRTGRLRRIEAFDATSRDHSQVVAFLGEIWMIGGRFPETFSVAIYDPVSERWRAGPSLMRARAGFAAAVVGPRIVIGGGELLLGELRVEPSTEVYTAGLESWRLGPDLADPVHGVAAAGIGDRWYVISGARQAGSTGGTSGRVFELEIVP